MTAQAATLADLIALARDLEDGGPCPDDLLAAVFRTIDARRAPDDPPRPQLSGLRVRRYGLPEWWTGGGSLMLAAAEAQFGLSTGLCFGRPSANLALVGSGVCVGPLAFPAAEGLIAIGDRVRMPYVTLSASNRGMVLIGEDSTARSHARVDSRNGGAIMVGADGMWAEAVNLVTDDMHAIRDRLTDRRVNLYGGRITVDRHVWLGEQANILAGARIGANTVVGLGALVRNVTLPPNSVCAGSPARPLHTGTTWTREDLP